MEKIKDAWQYRGACVRSDFKVREAQDGQRKKRYIDGYFSVFDVETEFLPGCFEKIDRHAFDEELTGDVRALADHDSRIVLGRTTAGTMTLRTDDHGLFGTIEVNEEDSEAMNVRARCERGDVSQGSFGFDILEYVDDIRADGTVHSTIKKVKLYEVSVVTFPAYASTDVESRSARIKEKRDAARKMWKAEMLKKLNAQKEDKDA